jgi:RNA polymerase sigma-70 factor (sigma-E family)
MEASVEATAQREFLEFCRVRTAALFRVAYGLMADQQLAEDLLQTALERVARRWRHIDDPDAYVRRIMYNESVSWWRRWRRQEAPVADPPERAEFSDPMAGAELRRALRDALVRLGPRQRAVLVLRYLEDYSEREVAAMLGCAPSTVSSQASRALARLRELCPDLVGAGGTEGSGRDVRDRR